MKEKILEYIIDSKIDLIGFTKPDIFDNLKERLTKQKELGFSCSIQETDIEIRTNPYLIMPEVKTIISIAISYSRDSEFLKEINDNEVYFSSSSWGKDYHLVLKEELKKLENFINEEDSAICCQSFVDTGPLCDRTIAFNAGLGYFGVNNLLINDTFGSYIFLGYMLINKSIEPDEPLNKTCLECMKCVDMCPAKAINEHGILDANKCLSYITQKKGELTTKEEELINQKIYGCDTCGEVCPHNHKNNDHQSDFIMRNSDIIKIDEFDGLSNKKFKLKYGHLAGSWRGKKIIKRNIDIYKRRLK